MSASDQCDRISVIEDPEEEVPKIPAPNTEQENGNPDNMWDLPARAKKKILPIPCCLCFGLIGGKSKEDPEQEEEPKLGTLKQEEIAQFAHYEVFLSFRGLDTRQKFSAHLYNYLERERFKTFRDDKNMDWGENIKSELHKAILNSRTSVVILSKKFANSPACLFEVQTMLEQRKKSNHRILPVFYEIQPEKIKEQAKCLIFKKHCSFKNKKEKEELTRSSAALQEVARMAGVVSKKYSSEPELIEDIIRKLKSKQAEKPLWVGAQLAATMIQRMFRGRMRRREFLNIRNLVVRIQAYVRGYLVRQQYMRILWAVSIIEMALLRWKRNMAWLRGFGFEKAVARVQSMVSKFEDSKLSDDETSAL